MGPNIAFVLTLVQEAQTELIAILKGGIMGRYTQIAKLILITGMFATFSNANATIVTNGLIGYWTGDGNANDSSSIGNNGSFSGNYVAGANGQQAFDIATGSVSIPNNSVYQVGTDFSVNLMFNLNGTSASNLGFIGHDQGSGNLPKWTINYNYANPNAFEFHINNFGASPKVFLPSNPIMLSINNWYDLTVVKSNSLYSFFLNGVNIGSDTFSAIIPTINAPLIIGGPEPALPYNGLIQDVSLYNIALSQSQINTLNNRSVPEPNTWALMMFGLGGLVVTLKKRRERSIKILKIRTKLS